MTIAGLFVSKTEISTDVRKQIRVILLEEYQQMLKALGEKDPFKAIVIFLEATGKLHDNLEFITLIMNGCLLDNDKQAHKALNMFQTFIHATGRNMYGINKTKKGETVTMNTVYLGNIYKLPLENLSFWTTYKEGNSKEIVKAQAKEFIELYSLLVDYTKLLLDRLNNCIDKKY